MRVDQAASESIRLTDTDFVPEHRFNWTGTTDMKRIFGSCRPNITRGIFPGWVWLTEAGLSLDYNKTWLPTCSREYNCV